MDLEWIPPLLDGGSKVTGYIVEFKEVNKEEEEKKAQRRLLLSVAEEKEPESDEGWEKVINKSTVRPTNSLTDKQLDTQTKQQTV